MEKKKYEKPSIETMDIQWSECIAASAQRSTTIKVTGSDKLNQYKWFGADNNGGDGAWIDSF